MTNTPMSMLSETTMPPWSRLARNRALHRALFLRDPFERHAFVAHAPATPIWTVGDYTTSDLPITDFVPWVVENYRRWVALSEAMDDARRWLEAARAALHPTPSLVIASQYLLLKAANL